MTRRPWLLAGLAALGLAAPAAAPALAASPTRASDSLAGYWTGVLKLAEPLWVDLVFEVGPRVRVRTRPVRQARGGETLKASALRVEGDTLHIEFRQISGVFEGRLTNSGRIDGVWRQPDQSARISLYRQGDPGRPVRPSPGQ